MKLVDFLNSLIEDLTPDKANDFVMTYDTSAGGLKKVKPANLGGIGDVVGPGSAVDGDLVAFDGTTGKLVKSAGAMLEFQPIGHRIRVNVFEPAYSNVNWSTISTDVNDIYAHGKSSTNAQNNEISFQVYIRAGTWTIQTCTFKATDCGIMTVSIDGSSVGTIDTYHNPYVYNQFDTITGVVVATSGLKTLNFKMATKNGSSSGYYGTLNDVTLIRTA